MRKLNDSGGLIIPITQIAFGEVILGHIRMCAKQEQHITIFNYAIGKMILQVQRKSDPEFISKIEEIASNIDWIFSRTSVYYLIERGADVEELHTIVELLHVPELESFMRTVARIVPPGESVLVESLLREPVPHVTLYTSDTDGKMGIGINSFFELTNAVRDTTPSIERTSKILAYLLPRRIIEGIVINIG